MNEGRRNKGRKARQGRTRAVTKQEREEGMKARQNRSVTRQKKEKGMKEGKLDC